MEWLASFFSGSSGDQMNSSFDNSVTDWIDNLKQGDDEAAVNLWQRYFERLVRVARKQLGAAPRRVADEEDVALSVFDVLCRGAVQGRFTELETRDDLWRLLVAITAKKVVDQVRRQTRLKRGGGDVRGHSLFRQAGDVPDGFDQFLHEQPTPDFLLMMDEEQRRMLARLRDDTLCRIALARMEGYSNQEIAIQQGISLRSVERKLNLIRDEWSQEAGPSP